MYTVFSSRCKPKPMVFMRVFAFGSESHRSYSVFWTAPSKNTGSYAVCSAVQEVPFPCQRDNNAVNYSVFGSWHAPKTADIRQKVAKIDFPNPA